jgi:hypothetical protein
MFMKRLIFGLMVLMLNSIPAFGWDLPLDFSILGMRFNHDTSSSASDAITIRKNYGDTVVTAPEYTASQSEKVAYSITVTNPTVQVWLSMGSDIANNITVKAECSNGNLFGLMERIVYINGSSFSIGDVGNPANYVTFQKASGSSLPTSVSKYDDAQLSWKVTKIESYTFSTPVEVGTTHHPVYTILSTPYSFVDHYSYPDPDRVGEPWTEVLDLACEWADGETSYLGCLGALTDGLNGYSKMKYDNVLNHVVSSSRLKLSELLQTINNNATTLCNCQDYSLLCTLTVG